MNLTSIELLFITSAHMAARRHSLKQVSPAAPAPSPLTASACADKLKVLADPTRLAVLRALHGGAKHSGELAAALGVEQSLMSHHLRALRAAGLVESQRDGKAVLYHLAPGTTGIRGESIDLGCCQLSFR
jgi:ArsR family transcriptional regulator